MMKNEVSLSVVRKANEQMANRHSAVANDIGLSNGDIVIETSITGPTKRFLLSESEIKIAYKKALASLNAEGI